MLSDLYNRPVNSMRISVTQRCNLGCAYCHREGQAPSDVEMSSEEISKIVSIGARLGIKSVKITGGEPLMRGDIVDIIKRADAPEVSMTTNGTLLEPLAEELARAGLKRVNIGCESAPKFEGLKWGLSAAKKAGLPVKLNMVVMKGINEGEIGRMVGLCREFGASLQLIELIETSQNREFYGKYHMDLEGVEAEIARKAKSVSSRSLHARKQYQVDGIMVEVVRPMHNSGFCGNCTRIRVTSNGLLKPCLMRTDNCVDFLSAVRKNLPDMELEKIFAGACKARIPYWRAENEN